MAATKQKVATSLQVRLRLLGWPTPLQEAAAASLPLAVANHLSAAAASLPLAVANHLSAAAASLPLAAANQQLVAANQQLLGWPMSLMPVTNLRKVKINLLMTKIQEQALGCLKRMTLNPKATATLKA